MNDFALSEAEFRVLHRRLRSSYARGPAGRPPRRARQHLGGTAGGGGQLYNGIAIF